MTTQKTDYTISEDLVIKYQALNEKKKELEKELEELKKVFHIYFDNLVGQNQKGEVTVNNYKLQRQIRKSEKLHDEKTVIRLTELNMTDLIHHVPRPDEEKVRSAITLGLLKEEDLEGCLIKSASQAIIVKTLK
ncbi:hypothetical protein [Fictibacillus barbaricus]|uniref:Uncharacterized protein n=1 Tax=Fictibacillus barbaricus TaxID=182136 RepID=A0ABS2ZD42_9BACL|nr:hypothetical protein [Fictibacillus barbaricus]MBN3545207.1 hypothetical protein [Fictibacillus barbaricus]GGB60788.1 hypothetical protein GCM10007199_28380 [Fictibacillus barbaricus]